MNIKGDNASWCVQSSFATCPSALTTSATSMSSNQNDAQLCSDLDDGPVVSGCMVWFPRKQGPGLCRKCAQLKTVGSNSTEYRIIIVRPSLRDISPSNLTIFSLSSLGLSTVCRLWCIFAAPAFGTMWTLQASRFVASSSL